MKWKNEMDTKVKLTKMDMKTFDEIMDYAAQNNHRFFTIHFDIMNGVYLDSPSIALRAWVKTNYGN